MRLYEVVFTTEVSYEVEADNPQDALEEAIDFLMETPVEEHEWEPVIHDLEEDED